MMLMVRKQKDNIRPAKPTPAAAQMQLQCLLASKSVLTSGHNW